MAMRMTLCRHEIVSVVRGNVHIDKPGRQRHLWLMTNDAPDSFVLEYLTAQDGHDFIARIACELPAPEQKICFRLSR